MDNSLALLLDAYNVQTLFSLALATGILPPKSKKPPKANLLVLLQEQLFEAKRVEAAWAKLNKREKDVLNRLLLHNGPVRTSAFRRELVRTGLVTLPPESKTPQTNMYGYYQRAGPNYTSDDYLGDPERTNSTIFQDVIARLTQQGLLFSRVVGDKVDVVSKLTFHPADELVIPDQLRRCLPKPTPVFLDQAAWQPARVEQGAPQQLLRELYLYWDFVRRNEVALLQNGYVGKRLWRGLGQALLSPEPRLENANNEAETGRLYWLRLLLQGLNLLAARAGKLVITAPDLTTVPPFWTDTETAQVIAVVRAWTSLTVSPDPDPDADSYYPQYGNARRLLFKTLRSRAVNDWLTVDDLMDSLAAQDENFLFADRTQVESRRSSGYYYNNRFSGTPAQLLKLFSAAEGRFVRNTIQEMLLRLGLAEVGYATATEKEWSGVRLTALGQQALAALDDGKPGKRTKQEAPADDSAAPPASGRVVVQPNFQILALGPVALATLAKLDLFAERRKADLSVFEYHLSRESVYRGKQAGLHVDEVIAFLQTVSGAPLPQNLARSLNEWGAHHQRIVFRSGVSLLQAADEATLTTLLLDEATVGEQVARVLAPGVALVRKGAEPALLRALLDCDRLPAISSDKPESADHSVEIDAKGVITPIHAVPSLHLRGRLARLAEEDANGHWRLTPATVRKAGGSRKKVLALIEELTKLQRGELPAALVALVKQWGAYYGEVGAATVTLLEFRDAQALQELLTHPDLQTHLTRFPAGERALAIVATKQLPTVKRILQTLGVAVKDELLG